MSRTRIPIGEPGDIWAAKRADGRWHAGARQRDTHGTIRQVHRIGKSRAAAVRAVTIALQQRRAGVTPRTPKDLSTLTLLWIDSLESTNLKPQTCAQYARTARRYFITELGKLSIEECLPHRFQTYVTKLAERTPSTARTFVAVGKAIFHYAIVNDMALRNPFDNVARVNAPAPAPMALDLDTIRTFQAAAQRVSSRAQNRPFTNRYAHPIVELMVTLGLRPGEVLALRRSDISIHEETPQLTVRATTVSVPGKGTVLQASPKTRWSERRFSLDQHMQAALRPFVRAAHAGGNDLIFTTRAGLAISRRTFARTWDAICAEADLRVTPREIRRTIGTLVERHFDLEAASKWLGHSSTAPTRRHYVERQIEVPLAQTETIRQLLLG